MKRQFFLLLVACLCVACTPTPQQKAEKVIGTKLAQTLVRAESYTPLETSVDSAFSPVDNPAFYRFVKKIAAFGGRAEQLEQEMNEAKAVIDQAQKRPSALTMGEYADAKALYDRAEAEIAQMTKEIKQDEQDMMPILEKGEYFMGYLVKHRYEAADSTGTTATHEDYFLLDKEMTRVIESWPVQELDEYKEALRALRKGGMLGQTGTE